MTRLLALGLLAVAGVAFTQPVAAGDGEQAVAAPADLQAVEDVAAAVVAEVVSLPPAEAAAALVDVPTGSLLFSKGQCVYVSAYTGSDLTHVGLVVRDDEGLPWVYDAMKGAGVRRSTIDAYLTDMEDAELVLYRRVRPLAAPAAARLVAALEANLGRPYDVAHYLTGQPSEGLHCSEYATHSLYESGVVRGRIAAADVSPAVLAANLDRMPSWALTDRIQLEPPQPQKPANLSCCEEWWWDTQECCRETGDWFSGLFFCR